MISRPEPRSAGFTLLETIVVLVVLGLALGLVVGRGPMRSTAAEARTVAGGLAETLRMARGRAIALNRPVAVTFDIVQHGLHVDGGQLRLLPPSVNVAVTTVAGNTFGQRMAAIVFAPDGSSSGGRIDLASSALRLQVTVDWLTGRVSVADAH